MRRANLHAIFFLIAAVLPFAVFAQTSPPTAVSTPPVSGQDARQEKPAVLRKTTRLVQVSAIVTDKSGAPVTGLMEKDFQLFDGGGEQTITVFVASSATAPLTRNASLSARTFTNRPFQQDAGGVAPNLSIVLFDGLNSRVVDQQYARQHVLNFLHSLHAGDLVAIMVLGNGLRVVHDFSTDLSSLLRVTERLSVDASLRYDTNGPDMGPSDGGVLFSEFASGAEKRVEAQFIQERVRYTLRALEAIANYVAGIPGRKNLIWVSAGFPLAIGIQNPEGNWARLDTLRAFSSETSRVMRAMNRANVAIYPIDARGLIAVFLQNTSMPRAASESSGDPLAPLTSGTTPRGGPSGRTSGGSSSGGSGSGSSGSGSSGSSGAGGNSLPVPSGKISNPFEVSEQENTHGTMREIAELTGGRAFFNTNDLSGAIRSAMDDSKVSYTLGYYPSHGNWDGHYREIKVQVKRPGLQVRFRRGYYAVPDVPIEEKKVEPQLTRALATPLPASAVGLAAEFERIPTDPEHLLLRVRVNTHDLVLQDNGAVRTGTVDMMFMVADSSGTVVWRDGQRFQLKLKPETYQRFLRDGMPFHLNIPAQNGAATLRIAAADATTGATGTLHIPFGEIRKALDAGGTK